MASASFVGSAPLLISISLEVAQAFFPTFRGLGRARTAGSTTSTISLSVPESGFEAAPRERVERVDLVDRREAPLSDSI